MTRLLDKIHSYPIYLGMDFNETFSGNPPTDYGQTNWNSVYSVVTSNGNSISGSTTDGPFPGQGSWTMLADDVSQVSRLRFGSSQVSSSVGENLIRTENYTYGIWAKINEPISLSSGPNVGQIRAISQFTNNNLGDGELWRQGFWFGYGIDYNPNSSTYGKHYINLYTAGFDYYLYQDGNGKDIEIGKWYFFAIRKTRASYPGTPVDFTFYIDGIPVNSNTYTGIDTGMLYHILGSGANYSKNFSISSSFFATSSNITQSEIETIWDYGAPIQVPVKYYDGSNWQTSSNQKIYNGTSWIPMYANRWTGTEWVPL